ncbi:MAG: MarR family winged helix-turn-helix transcriptional regulator [Crocinitomicaceae bacterium]
MKKEFLQSLEFIGFTARIKRLSDTLIYDAKEIYNNSKLDIEPNWHIIFLLLKDQKELTVTEIAKKLRFSHPGIIKITNKMKEKGYLDSRPDLTDSRKTLLCLSEKSINQFPKFEKKWNSIQAVVEEIVDQEFLDKLSQVENRIANGSISERFALKHSNND